MHKHSIIKFLLLWYTYQKLYPPFRIKSKVFKDLSKKIERCKYESERKHSSATNYHPDYFFHITSRIPICPNGLTGQTLIVTWWLRHHKLAIYFLPIRQKICVSVLALVRIHSLWFHCAKQVKRDLYVAHLIGFDTFSFSGTSRIGTHDN